MERRNVYTESMQLVPSGHKYDLLKPAIPPCEVGTLTVTILLLAGSGSLVVTTFPPTEVPVIWKVCPPEVATVVSAPAPNKVNKQKITTNTVNPIISLLLIHFDNQHSDAGDQHLKHNIRVNNYRLYMVNGVSLVNTCIMICSDKLCPLI